MHMHVDTPYVCVCYAHPPCLHILNLLAPVCIFSAALFKVKLAAQESRPLERRKGKPPEINDHDSAAVT